MDELQINAEINNLIKMQRNGGISRDAINITDDADMYAAR